MRTCELDHDRFGLAEDWLGEQRRIWADRTDRLDQFLTTPTEQPSRVTGM